MFWSVEGDCLKSDAGIFSDLYFILDLGASNISGLGEFNYIKEKFKLMKQSCDELGMDFIGLDLVIINIIDNRSLEQSCSLANQLYDAHGSKELIEICEEYEVEFIREV